MLGLDKVKQGERFAPVPRLGVISDVFCSTDDSGCLERPMSPLPVKGATCWRTLATTEIIRSNIDRRRAVR
jgi:hypothetical protein